MSEIPSISICLVTYNDSEELGHTLRGLSQDATLKVSAERISCELLISDNDSEDDTQELVSQFLRASPVKVRSYLQSSNLGFRGNLEFCASKAAGDWVLFLGAGDLLKLEEFYNLSIFLNEQNSDVIYFQSSTIDSKTFKVDKATYGPHEKPLFSRAPLPIFRTSKLQEVIATKSAISGNDWPQVEWALEISKKSKDSIAVFPGFLIEGRRPVQGWWSRSDAFLVPVSLKFVLRSYVERGHWGSDVLRAHSKPHLLEPALWVYQSRIGHNSLRPKFSALLKFWKFTQPGLVAILAWILLVLISITPSVFLRIGKVIARHLLKI